jgi:fatty acid desaturase
MNAGTVKEATKTSRRIDIRSFSADIETLREQVYSELSVEDYHHLRKIEFFGRFSTLLGYGSAWYIWNPFSAFLVSLGQFTRWLLMHHISHRGYDAVPGMPIRYTSKVFAQGWRRFIDWFDWIHPKAWDYEHNQLHHYNTGELHDPDLVERHTEFLRAMRIPRFFKYLLLMFAAVTWKYTYYAPNTMSVIHPKTGRRTRKEHIAFITIRNIFDIRNPHVRRLWMVCYLPYFTWRFLFLPALFFPLGKVAVWNVLITSLLAECITNLHSFLVIAPNHSADDLCRFDFHYANKEEFYLTQVFGSTNYTCGTELVDYLSIYLNYQIEHHLFPDLPMRKYREIQPQVKRICAKYGVPYRQEAVFKRVRRLLNVCIGTGSMRRVGSIHGLVASSEGTAHARH